jgi:hypothetical protein
VRHSVLLIFTTMLPLAGCGEGLLQGEVPSEVASAIIDRQPKRHGESAPYFQLRTGGKGKRKGSKVNPPSGPNLRTQPLTRGEARELAQKLGYTEASNPPFNSHGQPVFKSGNKYITPDKDVHRGGTWKMFDNKGTRLGTFNDDLTQRIGD